MILKPNIIAEKFNSYCYSKNNTDNEFNASYTHYLHNKKESEHYKQNAVTYIKNTMYIEDPKNPISNEVAEEALQYLLFDFKNSVPFPKHPNPDIEKSKQAVSLGV